MAPEPSLNPFALLRRLVAKVEKGINETANPVLKSGEFSNVANKLMSAAAVASRLAQNLQQRTFEALNVPSRNDLLALSDRLQSLEDRIIGIQATLDHLGGSARRGALPAPRRTRQPPAPLIEAIAAPRQPSARTRKPAQKAR